MAMPSQSEPQPSRKTSGRVASDLWFHSVSSRRELREIHVKELWISILTHFDVRRNSECRFFARAGPFQIKTAIVLLEACAYLESPSEPSGISIRNYKLYKVIARF